jgi:hypothetical protein
MTFRIDVYHHGLTTTPDPRLDEILAGVRTLLAKGEAMAGEIERLEAGVAEIPNVVGSVEQLVANLATEIRNLRDQIAAGGLSPEAAQRLTAVADAMDAQKSRLAALVVQGTPQAA